VDADPYRGTPLAWAAANGRVGAIRLLLEFGADPGAARSAADARSRHGCRPDLADRLR
jgi:ankyrin repeat protein